MKKEVKILIGVLVLGAVAYYFLRPKKSGESAITPEGNLDVESLVRVKRADDTPDDIIGGTRRTYKDSQGNIYKYTWVSANPIEYCGGDCGRYEDKDGNLWDSKGKPAKPRG